MFLFIVSFDFGIKLFLTRKQFLSKNRPLSGMMCPTRTQWFVPNVGSFMDFTPCLGLLAASHHSKAYFLSPGVSELKPI